MSNTNKMKPVFTSRMLDYSDPKDAAKVLASLGGKELLQTKYPEVYAAFLRTKRAHAKKKSIKKTGIATEAATEGNAYGLSAAAVAAPINLVEDKPKSDETPAKKGGQKTGKLAGLTVVQGNQDWQTARVRGWMKNVTQEIMIHSFYQTLKEKNHHEKVLQRNVEDISSFNNQMIQNHVEYTCTLPNGQMESMESNSQVYCEYGGTSPIVYMKIDHPRSKIGNSPIIMLYAREADKGEVADYEYKDNKKYPDPSHAAKTMFPVKGQITFNDAYKPQKFDAKITSGKPKLQYLGQGVSEYNYTYEEIAACFKISEKNSQVMTFELKEDWKKDLDISAYTEEHRGNMGLIFSFFIDVIVDGEEDTVPICIYSEANALPKDCYETYDDTNLKLPQIDIKWGCFAKDTRLRMADGSTCKIQDIRIGDMLCNIKGQEVRVCDIITGTEENIWQVRTKGGRELMVTETHPLATERGILPVNAIAPGDILMCEYEQRDEVEFCYSLPYHDEVYSVYTDAPKGQLLFANEIEAGDFACQSQCGYVAKKKGKISKRGAELAAQMKLLFDELDAMEAGHEI